MKSNIRTIGIDDSAFKRGISTNTFVFGVIVRGNNLVEGILRTEIKIDGLDATEKICSMIYESKYYEQLKAIFLRSSTIAAFNVINMSDLHDKTSLPIVTILSSLPDEKEVKQAISNLEDWKNRIDILNSNPPIQKIKFENKKGRKCETHIQQIGLDNLTAVNNILQITADSSCVPECLRIADLIGQSFKDFQF